MERFKFFLETILNILPALFWIVDPLVAVPIFLSITRQDTVERKKSMALRASIATWLTLSIFALVGPWILKSWFHISTEVFRIAGGLILLLTGIDMVRAQPSPPPALPKKRSGRVPMRIFSIVPLAIPMLAGPGAMSFVAVFMNPDPSSPPPLFPITYKIGVFVSIFLVSVSCALILQYASKAQNFLSKTSIRVFERIMGLLITAVAIGFILGGLLDKNLIPHLFAAS